MKIFGILTILTALARMVLHQILLNISIRRLFTLVRLLFGIQREQPFKSTEAKLPFDIRRFKAYVSTDQSFTTNFPQISTSWGNKNEDEDISKASFDTSDPYFNSIASAYVLSTLSGVCKNHFKESSKVPKITTSILRYFLYYHKARFSYNPSRLDEWLDEEDYNKIQALIPTKGVWEQRYSYGNRAIPLYWYRKLPKSERDRIKNVGYIAVDRYGGSRGSKYLYRPKVINKSNNDWMSFFQESSNGFTKIGRVLLEEAIQSYVYSVLGSQARKRHKIVGESGASLETQRVFHTIVRDTIAEDDDSVLSSNMRQAISSTNIVLDMTITPLVSLVPSKMIILDKPIPGYSNTLLTATRKMGFGKNDKINFDGFVKKEKKEVVEPVVSEEEEEEEEEAPTDTKPPTHISDDEEGVAKKEEDNHWDELSNNFYFTSEIILFLLFMTKR